MKSVSKEAKPDFDPIKDTNSEPSKRQLKPINTNKF
jgi:hypothetical protein